MKRFVYPIYENCKPLTATLIIPNGTGNIYKLELDLKNAFHQGYIDEHGVAPKGNKNPFLSEFEDLIDDCEELRFLEPGIGADTEAKIRSSARLGKSLARGLLSQHYGYTWFASIQNLKKTAKDRWKVEKSYDGDMPDWLIGNDKDFAVAEAKGVHSKINLKSAQAKNWRKQVRNVKVLDHGKETSLKTWIIATRFVTEKNKTEMPEMLVEDPPIEGIELNQENRYSFGRWLATTHIIKNLERLSQYGLIVRLVEGKYFKEPTNAIVWQCLVPQLKHFRFIGKAIGSESFKSLPFYDIEFLLVHGNPRRFLHHIRVWYDCFGVEGFFDGLEITCVKQSLDGNLPQSYNLQDLGLQEYRFISMLNDGSFIAPMSLMRPIDIKEL
jgi:hypothetical protein